MDACKVIIAHPGRQHSYQTAYAFQEGGIPFRFITSVWHTPSRFPYTIIPYLPRTLRTKLTHELQKKSFPPLQEQNIQTYPFRKTVAYAIKRNLARQRELFEFKEGVMFDKWTARLVKRLRPDVCIGYEPSCLATFQACKEIGAACVLDHAAQHYLHQQYIREKFYICDTVTESVREMINNRKKQELDLADYILTPSSYARQTFIDHGVPEIKLITIPYGADISLFAPLGNKKRAKKLRILFAGTPCLGKGIDVVEEAIKKIDGCFFIFAGPKTPELQNLMQRYPSKIEHAGYLHKRELAKLYQDADLFILLSYSDSFGLSVLEAMSCGIPVVITEHTGAKDIVRNGVDGWVIPPGDFEAFTNHISWANSHRNSLIKMGENAHTQARKYSWERYRTSIRSMYTTVTDAH